MNVYTVEHGWKLNNQTLNKKTKNKKTKREEKQNRQLTHFASNYMLLLITFSTLEKERGKNMLGLFVC